MPHGNLDSSSRVCLKEATAADAEGILSVMRAGYLSAYPNEAQHVSRASIEAIFANSHKALKKIRYHLKPRERELLKYWVAKKEDKVIGYCFAVKSDQGQKIHSLYVDPSEHGSGVGKALLDQALEWLGEHDVSLEVASYNQRAIAFYRKNGFEFSSESKETQYPGVSIPTRMMVKKVIGN